MSDVVQTSDESDARRDFVSLTSNERLVTLISFAEACSKPWIAVDVVAALKELQERRVADAQTAELRRELADARELIANAIGGTHETLCDEPKPPEALTAGRYTERLWGYKDQVGSYSKMGRLYEKDRADFWQARFNEATAQKAKVDHPFDAGCGCQLCRDKFAEWNAQSEEVGHE